MKIYFGRYEVRPFEFDEGKVLYAHESVVYAVDTATRKVKQLKPQTFAKNPEYYSDGFAWGYSGQGPRALAYSLLLDIFDGDDTKFYQHNIHNVKSSLVATWRWKPELEDADGNLIAADAFITDSSKILEAAGELKPDVGLVFSVENTTDHAYTYKGVI
tara:strand:+ start:307 stop:783 length:477 start_codon:yes stop_codon:yes gene_type:complete